MRILIFLVCLSTAFISASQEELWSHSLTKYSNVFQLDNDNIFIQDESKISLLNQLTGEAIWSKNIDIDSNVKMLEGTSIAYWDGRDYLMMDAMTGNVIDQSEDRLDVFETNFFWDLDRVVLELKGDDHFHLLNIDLSDPSNSWRKEVGELGEHFSARYPDEDEERPILTASGDLILAGIRRAVMIDQKGQSVRSVDFERKSKKVSYNDNGILYVVEKGKTIHFVDTKKGEIIKSVPYEYDLSPVIFADGTSILFAKGKKATIFDAANGEEKNTITTNDRIYLLYQSNENAFVISGKEIAKIDPVTSEVSKQKKHPFDIEEISQVNGITFVNNHSKASPINIENLALKFPKGIDMPLVTDFWSFDGFTAYGSLFKNQFELTVVNEAREKIWSKGFPAQFTYSCELIGDGLLVIVDDEVGYYHIKDGTKKWEENISKGPSFNYLYDSIQNEMIFYAGKRLYFFDLDKGTCTRTDKNFDFDSFDYDQMQAQMMLFENNLYIKGSNTIFITDRKGKILNNPRYKSIFESSAILKAITPTSERFSLSTNLIMLKIRQNALDHRIDRLSLASKDYPYVQTQLKSKDDGFIFINPLTGEERLEVETLGGVKTYFVDGVDGVFIYLRRKKLTAHNIK